MRKIYSLMSWMSLVLAYLMLNFAVLCSSLSRQCEKKGDGMLYIKDWGKFLSGVIGVISASYAYYYLSGGTSTGHFVIALVLTPVAFLALLIAYWQNLDELQGQWKYFTWPQKTFWLLAVYFFSPVICNWASIGLKWGGYETAAYYMFELRYWSLLKTPLLGLLCFVVAKAVKKLRLQLSNKARQTTTLVKSAEI